MKTIRISNTPLEVSRIAYGCMNLGGSWGPEPVSGDTREHALRAVHTALDEGINFFDHADIYARGKSEQVFSAIFQQDPGLRDKIFVQSKCGIRFSGDPREDSPGRYDFSYSYIIDSVEGSLQRLGTDYLDLLLLHRPDPLVEPEEVARAFDDLQRSGKVLFFGVSNHTGAQIALLQEYVDQPLVVNQLELNVIHTHLIDEGIVFNQDQPDHPVRGNGTLEYCRAAEITIQAWSPLAEGYVSGREVDNPPERILQTAEVVAQMAKEKDVSREAILIAWILRHPAKIQPIIGTTNPERIRAACQADQVELSREEWYRLFIAGRGAQLP